MIRDALVCACVQKHNTTVLWSLWQTVQWRRKTFEIGGANDLCACVSMHWGYVFQGKFCKLNTLRLLLSPLWHKAALQLSLLSVCLRMYHSNLYKSQKKFSKWKQVHVGQKRSKPAKQDGNDTTTHSHHPYILCHFANCVFVFVSCVHRRVVEGSGKGIAVCRAHRCAWSVLCCGWLHCSCYWAWQV